MWLEIDINKFYTTKQTAEIFEVTEQTIWRWYKSWKLKYSNIWTNERSIYRVKGETILNLLTN